MKVSNGIIAAIFLSFLIGFSSGVVGMWYAWSDDFVDRELHELVQQSEIYEQRFVGKNIHAGFTLTDPEAGSRVSGLMLSYFNMLQGVLLEETDDKLLKLDMLTIVLGDLNLHFLKMSSPPGESGKKPVEKEKNFRMPPRDKRII